VRSVRAEICARVLGGASGACVILYSASSLLRA
jgi:hypothetical protein